MSRTHYYNDLGILEFEHNRKLLVELAKSVSLHEMMTEDGRKQQRADLLNKAINVQYDHQIYHGFGNSSIGGSLTYNQWIERTEDDPTQEAFKRILIDAIERGFMHEEFQLMAWGAICDMQMTFLLSGEKDNDDEFGE